MFGPSFLVICFPILLLCLDWIPRCRGILHAISEPVLPTSSPAQVTRPTCIWRKRYQMIWAAYNKHPADSVSLCVCCVHWLIRPGAISTSASHSHCPCRLQIGFGVVGFFFFQPASKFCSGTSFCKRPSKRHLEHHSVRYHLCIFFFLKKNQDMMVQVVLRKNGRYMCLASSSESLLTQGC